MGRTAAVIWHASSCIAAGVLYFFFVLPRSLELLGHTSHTLGTSLRIVTGALIGLAALPVVFTLLRTRRPEFGTPQLALSLRVSATGLHVLAGALIIGTAVSEIWLSLGSAGQWLFGIYGGAAAIALLGMLAFYLAFVAELPPPPPKPLKVKKRSSAQVTESSEDDDANKGPAGTHDTEDPQDEPVATTENDAEPAPAAETGPQTSDNSDHDGTAEGPDGALRNRRPTGKAKMLGRPRRTRGGVAVQD
ncbi:MAG: hypothetical protein KDB44_04215 [Mycobacterium sp.]|nr:hypothetical protein [Mycobacterium sp.]